MVVLKQLLVATDFSGPSAVALEYGREFARSYGGTLHVLHVVLNVMVQYSPEVGITSPLLQENFEAEARQELDALITIDDRRTMKVVPVVESSVNVADGIVDYARRHAIDLIIVGTHGRSAFKQFVMGSAAERVVRTAPCPVLAVRERERDFLAPDALTVASKA
jgi:nucleotide-binding universal stress UspA family protein